jgi:hypothetical protein
LVAARRLSVNDAIGRLEPSLQIDASPGGYLER